MIFEHHHSIDIFKLEIYDKESILFYLPSIHTFISVWMQGLPCEL